MKVRIDQLERWRVELSAKIELLERGGAAGTAGIGRPEAGGEKKV